ncbi:MAG: hypothetical protein ACK54C_07800 [Betaproteobacteria bacterium]|jgi:hypothetical protein
MQRMSTPSAKRWISSGGNPIACVEKLKVLNDNYTELQQMMQDAFEDALLMGCDEAQLRLCFSEIAGRLENPYPTNPYPTTAQVR